MELENTGVELENTGVELENTGVELENTGVGPQKYGRGCSVALKSLQNLRKNIQMYEKANKSQ